MLQTYRRPSNKSRAHVDEICMTNPCPPTIFVADDDPAVGNSLCALLESAGYRVRVFASGDDVLATNDLDQAACLVLDVHMPGASGLEVIEELAACGISAPVIVISGAGNARLAARAVKAGAVDYFEKPIDGKALLASIEHALQGRLTIGP